MISHHGYTVIISCTFKKHTLFIYNNCKQQRQTTFLKTKFNNKTKRAIFGFKSKPKRPFNISKLNSFYKREKLSAVLFNNGLVVVKKILVVNFFRD